MAPRMELLSTYNNMKLSLRVVSGDSLSAPRAGRGGRAERWRVSAIGFLPASRTVGSAIAKYSRGARSLLAP